MENIGQYLQEKRKEKGLSLEFISSKTKLQITTLKSIENNDFSHLGGDGYTKIMITTYARVLGLSQREIDTILNKAPKIDSRIPRQSPEILHPKTILIHKNFFLLILLIILIAVLTYAVIRLYRQEKISFPFRSRSLLEDTQPLPEEMLDEENGEAASQDNTAFDILTEERETLNTVLTEPLPEVNPVAENEENTPGRSYVFDRSDYLTQYRILKYNHGVEIEKNYFAQYVASF